MIRLLTESDLPAYIALRRRSLVDAPLAFTAAPEDDFAADADTLRGYLQRGPDWVIFGAFDRELAGFVGLFRERHVKTAHRVHVWGMYVAPEYRRHGFGSALLRAAIDHARALPGVDWVHLSVSDGAPAARPMYEKLGFRLWGVEPDALRHDGRSVAENHMALRLK